VATINGYWPLAKRGFRSTLSCWGGVVITELPLQVLAVLASLCTILARSAPPPARRVAWQLLAVSCLGLLGLDRAGRNADISMSTALDVSLGADRRTDPEDLWQPSTAGRGNPKPPGFIRMIRIYRDYAHDADIAYGDGGKANHLDIWRRPDLKRHGRAPVLLQIPGGAWAAGNKRGQAHPLMSHLAELGWVCVSINYRLSPRNTWPDQLIDVKRAIAWVKDHISEYGGDPDFVAITGGSAGGHLSALAALTANDSHYQPGFESADTSVQAAIPFYGVYDFTSTELTALHPMMLPFLERFVIKQRRADVPELFASASPLSHVSSDAPPFFVLHGRNDSFIPVRQARRFARKLRQHSHQPVAYAELPYAQHAFDVIGSSRAAHAAVAAEQFLAEIYSRHARRADQRAQPCGS
jgi:acetyl esterase/lipase